MRITLTACLILLTCFFVQPAAAVTEKQQITLAVGSKLASVNGEVQFLENPPFITGNSTLVPLRFVSTAFLADVSWETGTKTASIRNKKLLITISPGKAHALVNGNRVNLTAPARLKHGTIYVPLRFISKILGAEIQWNEANRTINISLNRYKHQQAGFKFVCPSQLQLYNEDTETASFAGPGSRALVIQKASNSVFNLQPENANLTDVKVLLQSENELWIKKGNLIMAYKLVSDKENFFIVTYGTVEAIFNQQGRNEYELIISTLETIPNS